MGKLFVLLFLVTGYTAFAQEVTIRKDVIYKDDAPYAHIQKSGSIVHDFSISTLDGEEILAAIHQGDGTQYVITFIGSGAKAQIHGDFAFSKKLAKELVISSIIKDGKLNPAGERRFLLLHPMPGAVEPIIDFPPGNNNVFVPRHDSGPERNTAAPVMIFGNDISQDNTTIGTYKSRQSAANGTVYNIITFYSIDGNKVAEATMENVGATSASLALPVDKRTTTIAISSANEMGISKEIAAWLVRHSYL